MDKESDSIQKHLQQATRNYTFFCEVHSKLPNAFYDWKITILFYTALHLLTALTKERDLDVGNSHDELKKAIHYKKSDRGVKKHCYDAYLNLYSSGMDARYSGYLTPDNRNKYLKSQFNKAEQALKSIDKYMQSQGYKSILSIQEEFDFKEV